MRRAGGQAGRRAEASRVAALLAAGVAILAASPPTRLSAQGITAQVGHLFEADGWRTYRIGIERGVVGPFSLALYGAHLSDASPLGRRHWGAGSDLVVLRGRRSGPYLIGGVAGGFSSDSLDDWWHSWSAGGGYQLVLGNALALAGEARWRNVNPGRRDGVELSLRLGALFGGGGSGSRSAPISPPRPADVLHAPGDRPEVSGPSPLPPLATVAPAAPVAGAYGDADAAPVALADSVIAAALAALGTGYRLGGTTSKGFDCSGLIQHAYARHGIKLPRVSRDQAKEGEPVKRNLDALRPGDILTFSQGGRRITHVGLYLGDGRFVHSARRGVQISMLSDDDPQGRWYWKRWVGARRIVASE